ncbi:MAG TPA: hypothetical protein VFR44_10300 [Actinomycetota bacterium]|nr:hypothetical protein [Actinomycetota bacterium]
MRRSRRTRTGTVCVPLSGWRGERHPDVREPTPAELLRRCPFCGQLPGPTATEWCPSFDQIVLSAASGAADR